MSSGVWAVTAELDEGDNELRFRIGDDKDSMTTIHVTYTRAVETPIATPSVSPHPALAEMHQYLFDNFGTPGYATPWWVHIKSLAIEGDTVIVITDLTAHDENAKGICSAAFNLAE